MFPSTLLGILLVEARLTNSGHRRVNTCIEYVVSMFFTRTLWVFPHNPIYRRRHWSSGSLYIFRWHHKDLKLGLRGPWGHTFPLYHTAWPRLLQHYLPSAKFLSGGHFPSICQRNIWVLPSCQSLCIRTQVGQSLTSLCTSLLAKPARKPKVLHSLFNCD